MSDITPTDHYYKSRRFVVTGTGFFLLALFVGISPNESDSASSLFSFTLDKPEYIPTIFCVVVLYALWQFWANWYLQNESVRVFWINKIDFIATFAIAFVFIIFYILKIIYPFIYSIAISIEQNILGQTTLDLANFAVIGTTILSLIAPIVSLFLGFQFADVSKIKSRNYLKLKVQEALILTNLKNQKWVLWFNPSSPGQKKEISFRENGDIGAGRNHNEHTWRLNNGLLEILNDQDEVYSRFKYNEKKMLFEHTNDEDTLSLRSQTIGLKKHSYPL